jgi:hypothetical protein
MFTSHLWTTARAGRTRGATNIGLSNQDRFLPAQAVSHCLQSFDKQASSGFITTDLLALMNAGATH